MSTQKPFSLLDLTERQRSILLSAVGLDTDNYTWRNVFICLRASEADYAACTLWCKGLMTRKTYPLQPNCWLYQVTDEGLTWARQLGQTRYHQPRTLCSHSLEKAAKRTGASKLWEVPRRG